MIQVQDRFNVRIVRRGDKYGRDDSLTHNGSEPLVELYDAWQGGFSIASRGQFISRYYASTLLASSGGLCLDGGVPDWNVTAEAMTDVRRYVRGALMEAL